jgi:4-amino-4-deoxy-L-arabinose transferase-like glycosyltransferase
MADRFLTRRELAIWAALYVFVSALLVLTGFASDDPDSALYANLSAKLAQGPAPNWIAPQWWGYWDGTGLFREHPAGVFLIPTALTLIGIPAVQGSYVVGIGAGLASLLLIGWIVMRIATPRDGRAMLVLLQLMPVAFLFRIRANHEYPMLLCLLLVLIGLDGVRRSSWWWTPVVALALTAALLVKGVFIVLIFLAAGLWVLINPTRAPGSLLRPVVATAIACGVMVGVAVAYDAAYLRVTGETFWLPYWRRQLGPLEIATPIDGATPRGRLARGAGADAARRDLRRGIHRAGDRAARAVEPLRRALRIPGDLRAGGARCDGGLADVASRRAARDVVRSRGARVPCGPLVRAHDRAPRHRSVSPADHVIETTVFTSKTCLRRAVSVRRSKPARWYG